MQFATFSAMKLMDLLNGEKHVTKMIIDYKQNGKACVRKPCFNQFAATFFPGIPDWEMLWKSVPRTTTARRSPVMFLRPRTSK